MASYTKLVDYAAKDALITGNPAKAVKGTELGAEFDAIATADALNLKTADGVAKAGSNLTGGINNKKSTVASAGTPDIFAITIGGLVDYTGTATCTGFVAAPQAGSERVLYCAGACLFTAGANLLIEGIPSGTTITLAAGALVTVRAITTTQFKMTYSLSGTFTAICSTGMTTTPSVTANYNVNNGMVDIYIPLLSGTSNGSSFLITGLPSCLYPGTAKDCGLGRCVDNAVYIFGWGYIETNGTLYIGAYAQQTVYGWTSTGTKSQLINNFRYHI